MKWVKKDKEKYVQINCIHTYLYKKKSKNNNKTVAVEGSRRVKSFISRKAKRYINYLYKEKECIMRVNKE